jgi:anthranilate synthase component 1
MAPGLTLLGASPETMLRRGHGEATDPQLVGALREAFTAKAPTGAPQAKAARIIRDLEAGPRHVYGGAIGYLGPSGTIELAAGRQTVIVRHGYFEVTAGADIGAGTTLGERAEATRTAARPTLAAIRAAHEAQLTRELAAQRKAEAEKAAAEKAAAEKADVSGEGEEK